jgi:hypothetical protein
MFREDPQSSRVRCNALLTSLNQPEKIVSGSEFTLSPEFYMAPSAAGSSRSTDDDVEMEAQKG